MNMYTVHSSGTKESGLASDWINILFHFASLDLSVQGCIHRMKDCVGWTQMVMGYQMQHQ